LYEDLFVNYEQIITDFTSAGFPFNMPRSPIVFSEIITEDFSQNKILLYGTGPHSKDILSILENKNMIIGLVDDNGLCNFETEIPTYKTKDINNLDFDYVLISNSLHMDNMQAMLEKCNVPNHKIVSPYGNNMYMSRFKSQWQPDFTIEKSEKDNLVLIVPFENADHITRSSSKLKEIFNLYKLYYFSDSDGNMVEHFKASGSVDNSLYKLYVFLEHNHSNIDLIVINAIPSNFHLIYFIKTLFPDIKVIISVLDILSFYGDKEKVVSELEFKQRYDFELTCEDYMIKNCDGIIASISGKYAEETVFSKSKKYIQYYNFLPNKNNHFEHKEPENISFCYAGGYLHTGSEKLISADIKMFNVFKPLVEQGYSVEAFFSNIEENNINHTNFKDLHKLAAQYNFKFHSSKKIDDLLPMIKHHTFAIMFYDFTETTKANILKKHLCSAIPTKIFTYLAAGLPIIISEEIEAAAEFITKNGLGISISQNDIKAISDIATVENYNSIKKNILSLQIKFSTEENYHVLHKFLSEITGL